MSDLIQIAGTPSDWGLPAKFKAWRVGQFEDAVRAVDSDKRFVASCAPTGSGKSLRYMAYVALTGDRAAIVTPSKSLQDQLFADFAEFGLVDIRGKANYECKSGIPNADCEYGHETRCKHARTMACPWRKAYVEACKAPIICTNPAFWSLIHKEGEGLGQRDVLILDEAHAAAEQLTNVLTVDISNRDLEAVGFSWPSSPDSYPIDGWRKWADRLFQLVSTEYERAKEAMSISQSRADAKNLKRLMRLVRDSKWLAGGTGPWVFEKSKFGYTFSPLWPGPFAEEFLFLGIPKVLLTSATLTPKALSSNMLGIPKEEMEFWEVRSTFDRKRMPVYQLDTVGVRYTMTETDLIWWYRRIGQIVRARKDRSIIIHTVSYQRAKDIIINCDLHNGTHRLFAPQSSEEKAYDVAAFKKCGHAGISALLISPDITTGLDLPYEEAEVNIIVKLPFPDSRSRIMKARMEADKEYSMYLTAIGIQQADGRAKRADDDRCETMIIDNQIQWFIGKYAKFFSKEFVEAVRKGKIKTVPEAPPKLPARSAGVDGPLRNFMPKISEYKQEQNRVAKMLGAVRGFPRSTDDLESDVPF